MSFKKHWKKPRGRNLAQFLNLLYIARVYNCSELEMWVDLDLFNPTPAGFRFCMNLLTALCNELDLHHVLKHKQSSSLISVTETPADP